MDGIFTTPCVVPIRCFNNANGCSTVSRRTRLCAFANDFVLRARDMVPGAKSGRTPAD